MGRTVYDIIDRCAADMITVHAVGGAVLWASSSTEELFGWTPEQLLGDDMADLAHPDDRERVRHFYELSNPGDGTIRFRLRNSDGEHRWVESRTRASEEDGEVQLVTITRDVYQRPTATSTSGVHSMRISPLPRMGEPGVHRPTVLVVDDQPEMRQLLSTMLRHKYRVLTASNGGEALRIVQEDGVMAIVSDVMMPHMSGDELLRAVRSDPERAHTPVLLVTARTDAGFRTRALEDGATDYVTKPFDRNELIARIDNLVHSSTAFRKLRQQTRIDALTGVFTRARVLDVLQKQHELSMASDFDLSVLMVDVDHFKLVNDTHGHPVGDEVLREVARRIGASVRNGDAVGRYGGEEFLVVLPSCDYASALNIAESLRDAVRRSPVETTAGPVEVTISGGVAASPGGRLAPSELIDSADRALYRAKREGRDRIAA